MDKICIKGILEQGFGTISRLAMRDGRLTIEAKAIYSYFCSFAGSGMSAFPSRDLILRELGISKDRYYKHFKILCDLGYISVKKITNNKGQFENNLYTINIEIQTELEPRPQNKDTGKNTAKTNPCPENKDTEKIPAPSPQNKDVDCKELVTPCPYFPDTENKDTNINRLNNIYNDSSIINNLILSNLSNKDIDEIREQIKTRINFSAFSKSDQGLVIEFVNVMIDMLFNSYKVKGQDIKLSIAREKVLQVNHEHMISLVKYYKNTTTEIKNPVWYRKIMIHNLDMTYESTKANRQANAAQLEREKEFEKRSCKRAAEHFLKIKGYVQE